MATWFLSPRGGTCCGCQPLPCTPCTCPAPTLVCDSISASKTKCGWAEFGTPSSPPKKYLVKTLSGAITTEFNNVGGADCSSCFDKTVNTFSGACSYDGATCARTDTGQVVQDYYNPCITLDSTMTCPVCELAVPFVGGSCSPLSSFVTDCNGTLVETATDRTYTGNTTCCDFSTFSAKSAGSVSETLSSEYTTAQLIANAEAALPSYPGTFAGTCSSLRDLSSDELTYTVRRFKYKFILPSMTGITSYVINWNEGATAKSYTWDGVATETPVYGPVSEPGSNGTVGISSITVTCT